AAGRSSGSSYPQLTLTIKTLVLLLLFWLEARDENRQQVRQSRTQTVCLWQTVSAAGRISGGSYPQLPLTINSLVLLLLFLA
ncbi:MAG: hypothetical protein RR879_04460, partial [Hydrogenoanaerobacterium sp.]